MVQVVIPTEKHSAEEQIGITVRLNPFIYVTCISWEETL